MKHTLQKTDRYLDAHPLVTGCIVLTVSLLFFFSLHANTVFPDPDSFYHIKITQLMLEDRGVITEFPWLPLTILPDIFADQGWLYHALLIPFTFTSDPLIGLKVATTLLSTTLIISFFILLKKLSIKHAWAYPLLLLITNPFIFRISLAKTTAISVTLYLIGLYLILRTGERPFAHTLPLFLLMIFFVWTHAAWPLLIIAAGIYWMVSGIFNLKKTIQNNNTAMQQCRNAKGLITQTVKAIFRAKEKTTFFATTLGAITGLILNPTFPENLTFFWYQTVLISVKSFKNAVAVGSEWYGFDPSELIGSSVFIAIAVVVALTLFAINLKKQNRTTWTTLAMSAFLLYLTLKSRRNAEYLIPTATLFTALLFSLTPKSVYKVLQKQLLAWIKQHRELTVILSVYLAITMPIILIRDTIRIHDIMNEGFPLTKYRSASEWITQNIPPQSTILHTGWEDFPILFYHSTNYNYISGLDPTFLYLKNPDTHTYWVELTEGTGNLNPEQVLNTFGASTFVVERDHTKLKQKLDQHIDWTRSYEDSEVWIYTSS